MATGGKKKGRIMSSEELSSFCDQIALMLSSGMTLRDGIEMLAEDEMKDKSLKHRPYTNLYKTVDETGSLYVALKENEEDWPSYMIEMVDIGEQTGRLEDIMLSLSTYYQREGRIRSAAVSAVTYPLVLGVMLVVIIGILLWRVLPIFRRVLASLGVGASSSGSVLMQIGTYVGWGVLILIGLVVLAAIVIAILLKTKEKITPEQAREVIAAAPGTKLVDDLDNQQYPMPLDTANQNLVFVGRIREDLTDDRGLNVWCCGDQVRKGAATNAVQIAELVIKDM